MYKYTVGELYNPSRTRWPEAAQYNYMDGQHDLTLFWRSPSIAEVYDVSKAECWFGLFTYEDVIFFLYRFGGMPWSDAPYSWWLVPEGRRTKPNPEPENEERILLNITLVDANTGIIKALRAASLSPELTQAMYVAIREQASKTFDSTAYDRHIAEVYSRFPHSDLMAARAVKSKGGK